MLDRANSAEKLDITRFWDWQEAPVPHQAPEISSLVLGQKQKSGALGAAAGLNSSLASLGALQTLPAPNGLQSAINSITIANACRDLSNASANSALAGTLAQASVNATGQSLSASNKALDTAAAVEIENIRTSTAKATARHAEQATDEKSKTNARRGAMINKGAKLDAEKPSHKSKDNFYVTKNDETTLPSAGEYA